MPGKRALIDDATYRAWYEERVDPKAFWQEHGKRIEWSQPFTKVRNTSFDGDVSIKWFEDGETNVSANCIDRHLEKRSDQVAIIWEGDDPAEDNTITYREFHKHVSRLANVLKANGVRKGDRVTIYMPRSSKRPTRCWPAPASARCIRASSAASRRTRWPAASSVFSSTFVITADEGLARFEEYLAEGEHRQGDRHRCEDPCHDPEGAGVERTGGQVGWTNGRDIWYHDAVEKASPGRPPEPMNAGDPLFIVYTSGSTRKPKGVLHTTGGYLVYASMTHQ